MLFGKSSGALDPDVQFATAAGAIPVVVADFNGDGAPDIAAGNYLAPSMVSILLNGGGTFVTTASSSNPSKFGQPVTFTTTVTASVGSGRVPTGRVSFEDGTTLLGSAALVNGQASLTTSALSLGQHTIYAHYTGSSAFNRNQALPIAQQVDP